MKIAEIMTKIVITVDADSSITEVAKTLFENRIHAVPVLESGELAGIITETDFFTKGAVNIYLPGYIELIKDGVMSKSGTSVQKEHVRKLLDAKARDIMSFPCVSVREDEDVNEFMDIVREQNLNSVPVLNDSGLVVGIITLVDVINLVKINKI